MQIEEYMVIVRIMLEIFKAHQLNIKYIQFVPILTLIAMVVVQDSVVVDIDMSIAQINI